MNTLRLFRPLLILIFVLSGALSNPVWAGPVTSVAVAGPHQSTVDGPATASESDSFSDPNNGTGYSSSAYADAAGLSVSVTSTGFPLPYGAGASYSVVGDTTFNYQPDYLGGQDDWVEVGLTGVLSGSIVGSNQGGTGSARARVNINGNIWNKPPEEGGVFLGGAFGDTGDRGGSVRSFNPSQVIDILEFVSTGYFWVPRGEAVTFTVALSAQVYSDRNPFGTKSEDHGRVTANFADTFKFDPYNFFDILTPGITANSPALGLVNNQLTAFIETDPTTVPEPGTLALMSLGLFGLIFGCRAKPS